MESAWNWLNNKKTNIGAALLLAAMILQKMVEIWSGNDSPDWVLKTTQTLEWIGGLFAGIGLGHKGVKAVNNPKEPLLPEER